MDYYRTGFVFIIRLINSLVGFDKFNSPVKTFGVVLTSLRTFEF